MGWENRVVWTEGLFLQPQHLQQQDRYMERLVRTSTAGLRPFAWGLTQLDFDADLLTLGKFALRTAAGILPDGTPFSVPGDADHPRPLDLAGDRAQQHRLPAAADPPARRGGDRAPPSRWKPSPASPSTEHEAADSNAGYAGQRDGAGRQAAAALRARGRGARGVRRDRARPHRRGARRQERGARRELHPAAAAEQRVARRWPGFVTQLQGLLHHRAEALAGRVSETATRGAAEIADYLMLQLCNRYEPLLTHLADTVAQLHPETFYRVCVSLAGELATFTETRKRPTAFPAYRHDDLQATFRPVMAALRQSLSAVLEQTAVPIPLQERKFGIRVGPITDRTLVATGTWVLAVKAQMPAEALRRGFPNLVKIGPVEQIRELINVALPGDRGARPAGGAAAAAVLCRNHVFRAGPQQPLLGGAGALRRDRDPRRGRRAGTGDRVLGDQGIGARR